MVPISKKVLRKKHYAFLALPIALSFSLIPLSVQAICSRSDIDHYLEKGFTPSQITSICGAQDISVTQDEQQSPAQQSTTQSVQPVQQQEADRNFLVDVIDGYDTSLTADALSYTVKRCYEVGEEDLFGFAPEICPEIRYTLHLEGMKIVDTERKYFLFGPPMIILNGQVRREILTSLQDLTSQQKDILHKEIDTGDNIVLPIQQGSSIERVQTELHKILR